MPERGFGLRYSAFFRVSALGIRIWAAGDGLYFPDTPVARFALEPGCLIGNRDTGIKLESPAWSSGGNQSVDSSETNPAAAVFLNQTRLW